MKPSKSSKEGFAHPLGIRPLGNQFLDGKENIRDKSLGPYLSKLDDHQMLDLLEYLPAEELLTLSTVSKALWVFANDEEVWFALANTLLCSSFRFIKNWKYSVLFHLQCERHNRNKFSPALEDILASVRARKSEVDVSNFYSDRLFQKYLTSQISIKKSWLRTESIKILNNTISTQEFEEIYEKKRIPLIIKKACLSWPAIQKWTSQHLSSLSPSPLSSPPLSSPSSPPLFTAGNFQLSFSAFEEYNAQINNPQSSEDLPIFIFDPLFAEKFPSLGEDYPSQIPPFSSDLFSLLPDRPHYRWLLISGQRSASKWHIDPNATSAWNAVLQGKKRWFFFDRNATPPGVFPSKDRGEVVQPLTFLEWLESYYEEAKRSGQLLEGTCEAGDVVFVPEGYWHAVLNVDENLTVALTQNYVSFGNLMSVRDFLRNSVAQISGVACERREGFGQEFDEVLTRAGILTDGEIDEKYRERVMRDDGKRKFTALGCLRKEGEESEEEEEEDEEERGEGGVKSAEVFSSMGGSFWNKLLKRGK